MTLDQGRIQLGRITLWCSILLSIALLIELSIIPMWSHVSRAWLRAHPWLWQHSDDRHLLRLYINSWMVSIALFFVSLAGAGSVRRKSFIIAAATVAGFPAIFFGLLALETVHK